MLKENANTKRFYKKLGFNIMKAFYVSLARVVRFYRMPREL